MSHTSNYRKSQDVPDDDVKMQYAYAAGDPHPATTTFTWPDYRRQQPPPPPSLSPVHYPFNPTAYPYHAVKYYGGGTSGGSHGDSASHGLEGGLFPNSSSQPYPVPSTPSNASEAHLVTENDNEVKLAMDYCFPARSMLPGSSTDTKTQGRWLCQWPGCQQTLWWKDRQTHAMKHSGKKQFICSCGQGLEGTNERIRHLIKYRICKECPRRVGKGLGSSKLCSTCLKNPWK